MTDIIEMHDCDSKGHIENTLVELIEVDLSVQDLTHKHYADRLLACLQRFKLIKEWESLLCKPEEEQTLVNGAVLIAQWVQYDKPSEITNKVSQELERLTEEVRQTVAVSTELQDTTCPVTDQRFLEAVRDVMFTKENFSGNTEDYYDLDNSMINEVLERKKGIPITLAVVFTAIARRLGVKVEPVNFPNHFLLRWKCNHDLQAADGSDYQYIDCFNGGRFLSKDQCMNLISPMLRGIHAGNIEPQLASARDVWIRMLSNIIYVCQTTTRLDSRLRCLRHVLELKRMLCPEDRECRLLQARVFVHLGINLTEAIETLEYLGSWNNSDRLAFLLQDAKNQKDSETEDETQRLKPKLRSDPRHSKVIYKVGMVMRHRRYHYGCVIWGWDPFCNMSDAWIQQMGVDRLPNGRSQPFYNVLGDDGTSRYAAEENLVIETGQEFNRHPDLGKYFKAWKGHRYIPNYVLQNIYPEDNLDA
ncbi:F-box only protein 21 isoform X2 [Nematostella vectensis]|nr:F-box only protein 21 isoform X2 [Nematostella vectensis]